MSAVSKVARHPYHSKVTGINIDIKNMSQKNTKRTQHLQAKSHLLASADWLIRVSKASWFYRRWQWSLLILGALLLGFNVFAFYPGFMSPDSLQQLGQALNPSTLNDWHPPAMTSLWWLLLKIPPHRIGSMLLAQLSLLWFSLIGFALYIYHWTHSRKLSLLPLLIGLTPYVADISGVIWKDNQLAFSLLAASVLLIVAHKVQLSLRKRYALVIVASVLLTYAMSVRYNSLPAIIPLLFMLKLPGQKIRYAVILSILVLGIAASSGKIVGFVHPVQSTNPSGSIMIDDVEHIYPVATLEQMNINPSLKQTLIAIQTACPAPTFDVDYTWLCTNLSERNIYLGPEYPALKQLYIKGIIEHPLRYTRYRSKAFLEFLNPTVDQSTCIWFSGVLSNPYGVTETPNGVTNALQGYTDFTFTNFGFLYKPYFWLLVSAAVIIAAVRKRKIYAHANLVILLASSGALYILGYWPMVIGNDYRYIYWSVISLSMCCILLLADRYVTKVKAKI